MIRHRIIRVSELKPGLATIIVALPDRTIRSRAVMIQHHTHGAVQVAFECGEIVSFPGRSTVGYIEPEKSGRRGSAGRRAAP